MNKATATKRQSVAHGAETEKTLAGLAFVKDGDAWQGMTYGWGITARPVPGTSQWFTLIRNSDRGTHNVRDLTRGPRPTLEAAVEDAVKVVNERLDAQIRNQN